jgi:hypothetical protein
MSAGLDGVALSRFYSVSVQINLIQIKGQAHVDLNTGKDLASHVTARTVFRDPFQFGNLWGRTCLEAAIRRFSVEKETSNHD